MPYGLRLRKTMRRTARRARRNTAWARLNGFRRSTKSLGYKTRKHPYSVIYGSSLHVDRPVQARGFMPNVLFTQLRYAETFELSNENISGISGNNMAYRLNSLFDPNFTILSSLPSHQPLGFDQLSGLYRAYTVYKVEVQVRITGYTASTTTARPFLACAAVPTNSTWTPNAKLPWEIQEQPMTTVLDGTLLQSWNHTYWINEIEGKTKQAIFDNNAYSALVSTNPASTPYLCLTCGEYSNAPGQTVRGLVSFVFHARFTEPNPQTYS